MTETLHSQSNRSDGRDRADEFYVLSVSRNRRAAGRAAYGDLSRKARRHERLLLALLLLFSLAIRGSYLAQTWDTSLLASHEQSDTDMAFFHEWATRVAAGEWLFAEGLHPWHPWHAKAARAHLRAVDKPYTEAAGRAVWDRWYGGPRFHQEPLYPYSLGLLLRVTGGAWRSALLLQSLMGAASIMLIYWLGKMTVGRLAGLAGAALAAVYGPFLIYEGALLRCAPTVLATALFLALVARARRRRPEGLAAYAAIGLTLGALCLLRMESLALGAVAAWILARGLKGRQPSRKIGVMAGVALLCLLPLAIRNALVGASLLSFSSVGAVTALVSNSPGFSNVGGWRVNAPLVAEILGQTDGQLAPSLLLAWDRFDSPGAIPAFLFGKFLAIWHWWETPNRLDFFLIRQQAPTLRYTGTFVTVAYPALLGIVLAWPRRRRLALLYAAVLFAVLRMTLFYALARFRAPFVVVLAPFAGFAAVHALVFIASFFPPTAPATVNAPEALATAEPAT